MAVYHRICVATADVLCFVILLAQFVEAREEIACAQEAEETVYFNEEVEIAQEAVADALKLYNELIGDVDEDTAGEIKRANGMKMAQLQGELDMLGREGH